MLLLLASVSTVFLTGCPDAQQQAAAPKPPASSTAPALPKAAAVESVAPPEQAAANPRVASLMTQVDKSYRSGVANYRGGRLDAARR